MIGQRHRGVADLGRKQFDQHRRDWSVHHGDKDHQNEQQPDHGRHLWPKDIEGIRHLHNAGVAGFGVSSSGDCGRYCRIGGLGIRVRHVLAVNHDLHARTCRAGHGRILDRRLSQEGAGGVARCAEHACADRIEQIAASCGVGYHLHFCCLDRLLQRGVRVGRDHPEDRKEGQRRDQATGKDDRLAAYLVGQRAEHDEEPGAEHQRPCDQQVGGIAVDLQNRLQEEQRVELTGIPDHALTHGAADQRQDDDLGIAPVGERFGQRCFRALALVFHLLKHGRFIEAQPDPDRDCQQHDGYEEWDTPAPSREIGFADSSAGKQDHQQREEQAQRGSGLNERSVIAAFALRRMLGHISSGTAILAAQRQTLRQTQRDQNDRRGKPDGCRIG